MKTESLAISRDEVIPADDAEAAFASLGSTTDIESLSRLIDKILQARNPELAFFSLLRVCMSGALRVRASALAQVIIDSRDPAWALTLLQTIRALNARDPDQPRDMPGQAPVLSVESLEGLFRVLIEGNDPELFYHALRTASITPKQKSELIATLARTKKKPWIEATLEDVYLLPEDRDILQLHSRLAYRQKKND